MKSGFAIGQFPTFRGVAKVIGDPAREPVNRMAARVIMPSPWWAKPLPPEKERTEKLEDLTQRVLVAESKLAHERSLAVKLNARIRDLTGSLNTWRSEEVKLRDVIAGLKQENAALSESLSAVKLLITP